MTSIRTLIAFFLFAVFFGLSCEKKTSPEILNEQSDLNSSKQQPQNEPELAKNVSVTADVFKPGESKVYRVEFSQIPNAPPLADVYRPLNTSYRLSSNAIATNAVATFSVAASDEKEFNDTRILLLNKEETSPGGYEWQDCTIGPRKNRTKNAKAAPYNERLDKFVPDFSQKKISCIFDRINGTEETFFTVVVQTEEPPLHAFTKIVAALDRVEKVPGSDETVYTVSVSNMGPKAAGEINIFSNFDENFELIEAAPSAGLCRKLSSGTGLGSTACFLGQLGPAEKATITFRGRPLNFPGEIQTHQPNKNWRIIGYAKEKPSDPRWPANRFSLDPLRK